jgi:hypothetical protein
VWLYLNCTFVSVVFELYFCVRVVFELYFCVCVVFELYFCVRVVFDRVINHYGSMSREKSLRAI